MADTRLAHAEDLGQLQYAEGIAAQRPQDIQPQLVTGSLAEGGQLFGSCIVEGRKPYWFVHGGAV